MKRTEAALNQLDRSLSDIEAVFITHEHSDHIAGLPMITKHHHVPVIANQNTLNKIMISHHNIDKGLLRVMPTGSRAVKDEFCVMSFASRHDGVEPVGYTITYGDIKLGILTDSGEVTEEMNNALCGCRAVLLESNHDVGMLRCGPYPYNLQQRILGSCGHLSNMQCAKTLAGLIEKGTEHVFLGHLSNENNTPKTAMDTVCCYLEEKGIVNGKDVVVEVSPRYEISGVFEV